MKKLIATLIMLSSLISLLWSSGIHDTGNMRSGASISRGFRQPFRMPKSFAPETNRAYAISEVEKEVVNGWTGQFYPIERLQVGYTPQMQPNMYTLSYYDNDTLEWYPVFRQEITYLGNGKPEITFFSNWDRNTEKWVYAGSVECEYYPDFRIRQVSQYQVNDPEPVSIAEFIYDPQNRISQVIKTSRDGINTTMNRDMIFYDDRDRVSFTIYQDKDVKQHWVDIMKTVITYLPRDNSNYEDFADLYLINLVSGTEILNPYANVFKLLREDNYFRNALDWEYGYYRTFTYDNSMKIMDTTDWGYTSEWIETYKNVYSYDTNDLMHYMHFYVGDDTGLYLQHRLVYYYDVFTHNEDPVVPVISNDLSISPNPFRETTTLSYKLSQSCPVEISIYDLKGRLIRSFPRVIKTSGDHTTGWDGSDDEGNRVSSGIYIVRQKTSGVVRSAKAILIK